MRPRQSTYSPKQPVDVRLTLAPLQRGAMDPTMRWEPGALWRTTRTPDGPATLHLKIGREIQASAWGPGAERAIAGVPALLGAGDDWARFDATHPFVREARHRMPGLRLARTGRLLEALVPAVLEQKITQLEARRAWRQLVSRYGEEAPGPAPLGMRVFPAAEVWRRVPSWEWHRAGVGPHRSATVLRIVRVADSLERLAAGEADDVGVAREAGGAGGAGGTQRLATALRSIPGVGVWTVAETLQRSHGHPDAVSVGDYHLHDSVGWALAGRRVDDDGMLELLAPWHGQRQRVVRLITASGVVAPRRGPRMTVQDHRRH